MLLFECCYMGIGDWGLGIGDWGLGPIPNPQSPSPYLFQIKNNFKNKNNLKRIKKNKIIKFNETFK